MDYWVEVREFSAQGLGVRAIAKKLRIARNTVRKILRGEWAPPTKRQRAQYTKLMPFREDIVKMLKSDLIGTRIMHELRAKGYNGSRSPLYRFLKELKKTLPRKREKVTCRFETLPGIQSQFDWSPYRVLLGGHLTKIIVYNLILSWSRKKFYWPSLSETQSNVFDALEQAFWSIGGTTRELLVDNAKAFVKDARPEHFEWNPHFRDFCEHYDIIPRACRVRRSQTKGKVERPFYYLEEHFIKGREFSDLGDFSRKLTAFNEEIDHRVHQTLGVTPASRFEEERHMLKGLPPSLFLGSFALFRKVSHDCLVSFDGSRYSVPFVYAGKEVSLRVSQGITLEIYSSQGEIIAAHKLSHVKNSTIIDQRHYEGLRTQSPRTMAVLRERFEQEFPEDMLFFEKLTAQYKWNAPHHLRAVMDLLTLYDREELRCAFALALSYNTFSSRFLRGVLEKKGRLKDEKNEVSPMVPIPRVHIARNLNDYRALCIDEGGGSSWNTTH